MANLTHLPFVGQDMDHTFVIDGNNFSTLQEFYEEFRRVLTPEDGWGFNLDAFNDVLRGGFGTPYEGYTLVWKNSNVSRQRLGYSETVTQLERRLAGAHHSAWAKLEESIAEAKRGVGPTVFDWLVNAIRKQNPKIKLVLE